MHWKKLINYDYLGAYSLEVNGEYKPLIVQIKSVAKKMVKGQDGKDSECIVADLHNQKPIILNRTNCKAIEKVLGTPNIEQWQGQLIQLEVSRIRAFGESVDALRVNGKVKPQAAQPKQDLNPSHEKWQGAIEALKEKKTTIEAIQKAYIITDTNLKLLSDAITAV